MYGLNIIAYDIIYWTTPIFGSQSFYSIRSRRNIHTYIRYCSLITTNIYSLQRTYKYCSVAIKIIAVSSKRTNDKAHILYWFCHPTNPYTISYVSRSHFVPYHVCFSFSYFFLNVVLLSAKLTNNIWDTIMGGRHKEIYIIRASNKPLKNQ